MTRSITKPFCLWMFVSFDAPARTMAPKPQTPARSSSYILHREDNGDEEAT